MVAELLLRFSVVMVLAILMVGILIGFYILSSRALGLVMNKLGLGISEKEMQDRLILKNKNSDINEIRGREQRNAMKIRHFSTKDDSYKRRR